MFLTICKVYIEEELVWDLKQRKQALGLNLNVEE